MKQTQKTEAWEAAVETCLEAGHFDEALERLQHAAESDPENGRIDSDMGLCLAHLGRREEAEQHFLRSVSKSPDESEAYFNLGWLAENRAEFEEALPLYKEAYLRENRDAAVLERLAVCSLHLGREEDARAFYEEAVRLTPDSLTACTALASLYLSAGRDEEAEQVVRLGLVSHPDEPNLRFSLGVMLESQNQHESAIAQFNRVIRVDGAHAEAFDHLGDCCMALELYKQAEPFYAKAFKLGNGLVHTILKLGNAYEAMKKIESAMTMYGRWLEMMHERSRHWDETERELVAQIHEKVEPYLEKAGDGERAGYYRSMLSSSDENAGAADGSETYRVSLEAGG